MNTNKFADEITSLFIIFHIHFFTTGDRVRKCAFCRWFSALNSEFYCVQHDICNKCQRVKETEVEDRSDGKEALGSMKQCVTRHNLE